MRMNKAKILSYSTLFILTFTLSVYSSSNYDISLDVYNEIENRVSKLNTSQLKKEKPRLNLKRTNLSQLKTIHKVLHKIRL